MNNLHQHINYDLQKEVLRSKQQVEESLKAWRESPSLVEGNKTMWKQLKKFLKNQEGYLISFYYPRLGPRSL
jgi:hypothetical protein